MVADQPLVAWHLGQAPLSAIQVNTGNSSGG